MGACTCSGMDTASTCVMQYIVSLQVPLSMLAISQPRPETMRPQITACEWLLQVSQETQILSQKEKSQARTSVSLATLKQWIDGSARACFSARGRLQAKVRPRLDSKHEAKCNLKAHRCPLSQKLQSHTPPHVLRALVGSVDGESVLPLDAISLLSTWHWSWLRSQQESES